MFNQSIYKLQVPVTLGNQEDYEEEEGVIGLEPKVVVKTVLSCHYKGRLGKTPRHFVGPPSVVGKYECYASTSHNLFVGIVNRVLLIKIPDGMNPLDGTIINGFLLAGSQKVSGWGSKSMTSIGWKLACKLKHVKPISRSDVVESRPRDKYQAYFDSNVDVDFREGLTRHDGTLQNFVKWELSSRSKEPRIISPRSRNYNLFLGKYIVPLELPCYGAIDKLWGSKTVYKHCSLKEMANGFVEKFGEFSCPVAVGLDASRFDQHVSKQALLFEHSVYNSVYHSDELWSLLKRQLVNNCFARGDLYDIRYRAYGRMSGDMNTSLGNVIIMTSMLLDWKIRNKLEFTLVNNGDDSVAVMESKDLERFLSCFDEFWNLYGFNMVAEEPVYSIEHVEFCQMKPVKLDSGWMMVRKPTSVFKDMIAISTKGVVKYDNYLCDVGLCGLSLYSDCPILGQFYFALSKLGKPSGDLKSGLSYWAKRTNEVDYWKEVVIPRDYSLIALQSYCKSFNLDPHVVSSFEELVASDLHAAVDMLSQLCND